MSEQEGGKMDSLDEFLQLRDGCTPNWSHGIVKDRNGREYQAYKCECVTESGVEFQCLEDKVLMDLWRSKRQY